MTFEIILKLFYLFSLIFLLSKNFNNIANAYHVLSSHSSDKHTKVRVYFIETACYQAYISMFSIQCAWRSLILCWDAESKNSSSFLIIWKAFQFSFRAFRVRFHKKVTVVFVSKKKWIWCVRKSLIKRRL
jgi:hypothetical protein